MWKCLQMMKQRYLEMSAEDEAAMSRNVSQNGHVLVSWNLDIVRRGLMMIYGGDKGAVIQMISPQLCVVFLSFFLSFFFFFFLFFSFLLFFFFLSFFLSFFFPSFLSSFFLSFFLLLRLLLFFFFFFFFFLFLYFFICHIFSDFIVVVVVVELLGWLVVVVFKWVFFFVFFFLYSRFKGDVCGKHLVFLGKQLLIFVDICAHPWCPESKRNIDITTRVIWQLSFF